MKLLKNTNLYSRLALITSVTLMVGYFVVYAWYAIPDVNTGDILTKDLINHMLSNITELKTSIDSKISSQWNTSGSDINYTAGKVGIGTAIPAASLDVKRTAADTQFAGWIEGSDVNNYGLWVNIANTTSTKAIADFKSGNTSRLFVRADGNVGIGTSIPRGKLDVLYGASSGVVFGAVPAVIGQSSSEYPSFGYNVGFTSTPYQYNYITTDTAAAVSMGNGGRLSFKVAPVGTIWTTIPFIEAVSITNAGNVGIGTTTPGTRLSVVGAIGATAMSVGASANNWAETIYGSSVANQSFGTQITGGTNTVDYGLIVYNYAQTIPMLAVRGDGYVGIWTLSPAYKLQVMWSVASNSVVLTSDLRFKKNIAPITSALDTIEKLRGVTFDWRIGEFTNRNFPEGKQVGFIAQEVEKVLPELVTTDKEGYKWVEYANITAVLVEAVKEQQRQMEILKNEKNSEINELKIRIENLENK